MAWIPLIFSYIYNIFQCETRHLQVHSQQRGITNTSKFNTDHFITNNNALFAKFSHRLM